MLLSEKFNKSPVILLAPLDWGLGHATRCIPIINYLLRSGCEVIVAGEGNQQILLEQEFKAIRFVNLHGYQLKYGAGSIGTIFKIIRQIPKILRCIEYENGWVKNFLRENKVDAIISDNRYGFYHNQVPSVFITHQLMIKTPFGKLMDASLQKTNYRFIGRFSACWVPDCQGTINLAGALSHPVTLPPVPIRYIGRLTRLVLDDNLPGEQLLIILSGPEPQRTIFEQILLRELANYNHRAVLVRGLPGNHPVLKHDNNNLVFYNYLSSGEMRTMINASDIIISRSGYSTVMDVAGRKKCIFVPTPGQSEQEYLARYLYRQQLCVYMRQHHFSLEKALAMAKGFSYRTLPDDEGGMEDAVDELLREVKRQTSNVKRQ